MEIQNFTIVTRTGSRGEFPLTLDRFSLTSCLGEICEGKSKLINVFCHLDFVFIHIVLYGWGFSKCFQCHGFPDHNTRSLLLFFLYYQGFKAAPKCHFEFDIFDTSSLAKDLEPFACFECVDCKFYDFQNFYNCEKKKFYTGF